MLALLRETGEEIVIGDNIIVKVLKAWDGKARLGIDAPQDISVHRREVYDAIKRENEKRDKNQ